MGLTEMGFRLLQAGVVLTHAVRRFGASACSLILTLESEWVKLELCERMSTDFDQARHRNKP